MTDKRDPRGIVNFFVRYLVLHVIFLVGLPVSYFADLALIYFFGFMGIFTFFQMLIAITRKFLEKAGSWKIVAFVGAVFSDVAVLWFLGWLVSGISNGPSWGLVTQWLPYHFIAALCAWGLREFFYLLSPRDTATPSAPVDAVDPAVTENPTSSEDADGGRTKSRDPRGIMTFIVRYLVLHVIFLAGFSVSYAMDMEHMYFYGFMGIFTFFQVLIAITRKFLEKAGWWKPIVIVGAVFSDVAALWFLGVLLGLGYYFDGLSWGLVTQWLPYHFIAALCAWGLREFFRWLSPRDTATPSASDSIVEHDNSENPSDPEEESDAPTSAPASAEADVDTDTDKQQSVVSGAASSTPHRQAGGTPQPRPRQ